MSPQDEGALSGAEQLVAQGAIVLKAENDSMSSVAIARPRDEAKVKDRALAILDADAAAAEAAFYSIPFKEHSRSGDCTGNSDDSCPVKEEVEGIGIEGAREIARLWGNCSSRVYFVNQDDEWVYLSGVFLDLETNVRTEVPLNVSKVGRYRSGEMYVLYPDKLSKAISAGVSKVARNAIVQAVPRHISRAYYERAKEIVVGSGAVDVPKLVEAFATYDVSREMLEGFYQEKLEDLAPEKRRHLRGLFTAIRENLVTVEGFFGQAGGGGAETPGSGPSSDSSGVRSSPSAIAGEAEITGGTTAPAGPANEEVSKAGETRKKPAAEEPPAPEAKTAELGFDGRALPTEPSQPTPEGVESPEPNEPKRKPIDFGGLGI